MWEKNLQEKNEIYVKTLGEIILYIEIISQANKDKYFWYFKFSNSYIASPWFYYHACSSDLNS